MTSIKCSSMGFIKENLRRFWWVAALYFVCLFFVSPFRLITRADYYNERIARALELSAESGLPVTEYFSTNFFDFSGGIEAIAFFVLPVFIAGLLFSYMNTRKNIDTIHALPIKRSKLFAINAVSGVILYTVPLILTTVILAIVISVFGFWGYFTLPSLIIWLLNSLLYLTIFFGMACFFSICTGNVLVMAILTYVFSTLPLILYYVVVGTADMWLYGYVYPSDESFWIAISPAGYIVEAVSEGVDASASPVSGIIYLIFALVMLALSCFLYTKRRSEASSSTIAFVPAKPIIKYLLTFLAAVLAGTLLYAITGESHIGILVLGYLVGGAVAYLILHSIIQKDIRAIKKGVRGLAISLVVILVISAALCFDIFGYQKRVPTSDEVTAVYFDPVHFGNSSEVFGTGYTSEENVERIIALHQASVDAKFNENYSYTTMRTSRPAVENRTVSGRYYGTYADFNYDLGGKEMLRSYSLPLDGFMTIVPEILKTEEGKFNTFSILNEKMFVYPEKLTVVDAYHNEHVINRPDQVKMLIDAMKADILADEHPIDFELMAPHYGYLSFDAKLVNADGSLSALYTPESYAQPTSFVSVDAVYAVDVTHTQYYVKPTYKNTIEAAAKCGIELKPADYSNIMTLRIDPDYINEEMFESYEDYDNFMREIYDRNNGIVIKDPVQIAQIAEAFADTSPSGHTYDDYYFTATAEFKSPHGVVISYVLDPDKTPDFLYEMIGMPNPVK